MPDKETLKPCPFCGDEAASKELYGTHYVQCNNGGCHVWPSSNGRDKEDVINTWNRRDSHTPAPEQDLEIKTEEDAKAFFDAFERWEHSEERAAVVKRIDETLGLYVQLREDFNPEIIIKLLNDCKSQLSVIPNAQVDKSYNKYQAEKIWPNRTPWQKPDLDKMVVVRMHAGSLMNLPYSEAYWMYESDFIKNNTNNLKA